MQTSDDMELGHCFGVARGGGLPCLFEGHGVSGGIALGTAKGAQAAVSHADISGIDVAMDVEVGDVAMHPLAHMVSQPADGQDVAGAVERYAIFEGQTLFSEDLLRNGL